MSLFAPTEAQAQFATEAPRPDGRFFYDFSRQFCERYDELIPPNNSVAVHSRSVLLQQDRGDESAGEIFSLYFAEDVEAQSFSWQQVVTQPDSRREATQVVVGQNGTIRGYRASYGGQGEMVSGTELVGEELTAACEGFSNAVQTDSFVERAERLRTEKTALLEGLATFYENPYAEVTERVRDWTNVSRANSTHISTDGSVSATFTIRLVGQELVRAFTGRVEQASRFGFAALAASDIMPPRNSVERLQ